MGVVVERFSSPHGKKNRFFFRPLLVEADAHGRPILREEDIVRTVVTKLLCDIERTEICQANNPRDK